MAPTSKLKKSQSPLVLSDIHDSDPTIHSKTSNKKRKKETKQTREMELEDEEERQLTLSLFGGGVVSTAFSSEKTSNSKKSKSKKESPKTTVFDFMGKGEAEGEEEPLFMIDREAHDVAEESPVENDNDNHDDDDHDSVDDEDASIADEDKPAWQDEDDMNDVDNYEQNQISLLSSHRHKNLRKTLDETEIGKADYVQRQRQYFEQSTSARTDWARVKKSNIDGLDIVEGNESGDMMAQQLLSSSEPLLATKNSDKSKNKRTYTLPPSKLDIIRCKDVNWDQKLDATLRTVQFHPVKGADDSELVLTAGLNKRLNFFKVLDDGERTSKVHSIFFPDMPIYKASFLGTSGNVIASGRRPFFYLYHAEAGKMEKIPQLLGRTEKSLETFITSPNGNLIVFFGYDGNLLVWETISKRLIATLKINGSVRCASFTSDSKELIASGSDGDVYRFDMRTRRCISRFQNEDGTITSSLSLSSKFMAVGAESGVVNLYNSSSSPANSSSETNSSFYNTTPPIKSIPNLRTAISNLTFNPTGDILALSSRYDKNAVRLYHVPSQSVFSNWPTSKTPLGYVFSMDFSSDSKFLAVGNDKGKCLLYKLTHYE